jgi:hypothetical protein
MQWGELGRGIEKRLNRKASSRIKLKRGLFALLCLCVITAPLFWSVATGCVGVNEKTRINPRTGERADITGILSQTPSLIRVLRPTAAPTDLSSTKTPPQLLTSGKTFTGTLNGAGAYDTWYIFISSKATRLDAALLCPNATNFDLYGRFMDPPTLSDWDWVATKYGSDIFNMTNPAAGWWYIMVYAQSGGGTYFLAVNITYSSTARILRSGETVLSYLNNTGDSEIWAIWVDNGATSMRTDLGYVGWWLDLYEMAGAAPSTSQFIATSWGYPDLTVDSPTTGWWYIMPYSMDGNGIYQLTVTISYGNNPGGGNGTTVTVLPVLTNVVIGSAIGLASLSFFGVLIISRRRSGRRSAHRTTHLEEETRSTQMITRVAYREPSSTAPSASCTRCSARMRPEDEYCWNCGAATRPSVSGSAKLSRSTAISAPIGACMVCKQPLAKRDEILLCPYCKRMAHKYELLEWLHVKDYCPSCGKHLSEASLKKRTVP